MAKYQSFPGEPGDSNSLEKLESLKLPDLSGKSVLDIGCNSGFFSGYAKFSGAYQVDGIDFNTNAIQEAKDRFKDCNFLVGNFEELPRKKYDCILFLSAIHYAKDQEELIRSIIKNNLNDDGLLVLEIGVVDDRSPPKWFEIDRGIDKRLFCNWAMLDKILATYAWKIVSKSATQRGDPTPRFAIHVRQKKKFAILLSKPSGFGKTTISRSIFSKDIPNISLDEVILEIEQKKLPASERLYYAIKNNFSTLHLFDKYQLIGELNLFQEFIDIAIGENSSIDVVIDGFIPSEFINNVKNILINKSYFVIELDWENRDIPNQVFSNSQASLYFYFLGKDLYKKYTPLGRIDNLQIKDANILIITGWAVNENGFALDNPQIRVFGKELDLIKVEKLERPDVKLLLNLPDIYVGFNLELRLPGAINTKNKSFSVSLLYGDLELESRLFSY
jgi:SAM-dependent methyltransferase